MKLISLNIWGGHVNEPLIDFMKSHQEIDVFCLQEVYSGATEKISTEDRYHNLDIFSDIAKVLPNHRGLFKPVVNGIYGIAMFVKNDMKILDEGEFLIHENPNYPGQGPTHRRILQWVKTENATIMNVHGLWNGMGKTDTPDRIAQSKRIQDFMRTTQSPKILCGDFNLRPDTESMKIVEVGMTNLIKTHDIQSTRTHFYEKEEKFADYVLVSPKILVKEFRVMGDAVSDHAPLFLNFKGQYDS